MNRLVMDSNGSGHIVATRINQVLDCATNAAFLSAFASTSISLNEVIGV